MTTQGPAYGRPPGEEPKPLGWLFRHVRRCPTCGLRGRCATDSEGRALIHANVQEDA